MTGEANLEKLLRGMTATLMPETYVFLSLSDRKYPPDLQTLMVFEEREGTTLIVRQADADQFGLDYEFPCRMITLNVHSALEAVGFIASVATALAQGGMGVNPVAGFFHDHLFIPEGREQDALEILQTLSDAP